MMKDKLGLKRKCLKCNAFFYDLNKDSFACPKCKASWTTKSYAQMKEKQLMKLAKKTTPKLDDEELDTETLLKMTDTPITDETNEDDLAILEDEEELGTSEGSFSDLIDGYEDEQDA